MLEGWSFITSLSPPKIAYFYKRASNSSLMKQVQTLGNRHRKPKFKEKVANRLQLWKVNQKEMENNQ